MREINLRYLLGELTSFHIQITKELIDNLFKDKFKINLKKIEKIPQIGLVNGLHVFRFWFRRYYNYRNY